MKRGRACLFILLALFTGGCTGGRGTLRFDDLIYPVSTSAFLYGGDHALLQKGRDLDVVGAFHHTAKLRGIGWNPSEQGMVELGGILNEEIARSGGEGMVNLSITTSRCWLSISYGILLYIPAILPVMPGCADVMVDGEIVRRRNAALQAVPRGVDTPAVSLPLPHYLPPSQELTLKLFNECSARGVAGIVREHASPWESEWSEPYRKDIDPRAAALGANAVQILRRGRKPVSGQENEALKPEDGPYEMWSGSASNRTPSTAGAALTAPASRNMEQGVENKGALAEEEKRVWVFFVRFWQCPPDSPLLREMSVHQSEMPAPEM